MLFNNMVDEFSKGWFKILLTRCSPEKSQQEKESQEKLFKSIYKYSTYLPAPSAFN